jgi:hypothetical protein
MENNVPPETVAQGFSQARVKSGTENDGFDGIGGGCCSRRRRRFVFL